MLNLKDPALLRQQAYIDGAWCDADDGKTVPVINPATGETLGTVPHMGAPETRRAIDAAQAAWPAWRRKTARERALAEAVMRGELPATAAGGFGGHPTGKPSPVLACLLSAMMPGAGQLYNGQSLKGLICVVILLLVLILVYLVPHPGRQLPPLLSLAILIGTVDWLYAVIDAPLVASKSSGSGNSNKSNPSGWEV